MGKGGVSQGTREVLRIILWMSYVAQLLISSIYILLDVITFVNIWKASGETIIDPLKVVYNSIWRAPLASCILSALLVLAFNLLTCVVLIKKSINRSGPGFGYGFVLAYCFTLAFFCLLCSLVLDGFTSTVQKQLEGMPGASWSTGTTQVYIGTMVFGFICTGLYLLFSIVLVVFQAAVTEQLGISGDMNNPYAGLPEVPTLFVPPGYKSETPALNADAVEGQYGVPSGEGEHYGNGGYGGGNGGGNGYGQPGGQQYNSGRMQYTAYENEGYENESQGLTANGTAGNHPPHSYRAAGTTF